MNKKIISIIFMLGSFIPVQSSALVTAIDINDIVEQTIDRHPLVLSAKSEARATDEGISAARLGRFPEISVESNAGTSDPVAVVSVQQPIWTGGRIDSTIDQANFDTYAARANVEVQRYTVAIRALEAWQSFVIATNKKEVYLSSIEELNRFERIMSRRVSSQVSAKIELDLVVNRILQAQDEYEANSQQQKIALSRLQQLIGEPISSSVLNQTFKLEGLANNIRNESKSFNYDSIFNASNNHPSVIKANYEMRSAMAKAEVDHSNTYPQLFARYQHRYDFENNDANNDMVIGFKYAPGAGFSSYALARASEERVNSIKQNKEAAKREVIESLQIDYQQFASARDREKALMAAVEGALIVKESYERQFIAGKKSWLDVLNAVRELDQYEAQLVEERVNFIAAFYRLKIGMGLLPWQRGVDNG